MWPRPQRETQGCQPTAPVSVAFGVRAAAASAWKRVAIDDTPPYRAFLDPGKYPRRAKLQAFAVAGRSTDEPLRPAACRSRSAVDAALPSRRSAAA